MKHKQIIPFDLEKAKNGAYVVTRDGHSVDIKNFNNGDEDYPITAIIKPLAKNEHDEVATFTKEGIYYAPVEDDRDLFMSELKIEKEETEIMNETENTEETKQTENSDEYNQYLEYIGLTKNEVRSHNAGKSDYSKQVIQPWTIWHAYPNITTIDKDIIKRVLRTKEEGNLSPINSRILDYEKIIHDCEERIRQLKVLLETSLPFDEFNTEDDELINKQLEYYKLNSK